MQDLFQSLSPENQEAMMKITEQFMEGSVVTKCTQFAELNSIARAGGIVFAGDSITEGFPIHELFPVNLSLYNRGIGGITSGQLLDNLDAFVIGLNPKKAFILIGTNDIQKDGDIEAISQRVQEIAIRINKECPDTEIFLLKVFPVNRTKDEYLFAVGERSNEAIIQLNQLIGERVADMPKVNIVDLYHVLADSNGNLQEEYTADGLHLNVVGYQRIVEELLPML